ncbi:ABC transporter substrate-binding protein [Streptomyces sp. KL116D]|uniref:ABC transporter substrate-binding protein n=1 Tax=Streptomyces sp. KL116D TaxID=3045152 RepID=UPI0035589648
MKTPLHVELKTSTTPEWSRISQVIQAMAKDAGFAVTLRPTEYATMLEGDRRRHYDAFNSGWSGRLDPDGNIASFLRSAGCDERLRLLRPEGRRATHRPRPHRRSPTPVRRATIYGELIPPRQSTTPTRSIYLCRQKNYVVAGKDVAGVHVSAAA